MDPSWSAVFPLVAYNVWKYHNCTICIDHAWDGLALYLRMLETNYTVTPWTFGEWGDWNPAYPEPRNPQGQGPPFVRTVSHITAAAMVVQNHIELAELARGTGRLADATRLEAMVPVLKQRYHDAFFDPAASIYGDGTPTAFGAALWLGVTPPELLPAVVANFIKQLASVDYRMVSMGFVGVRYVFEALAKVNRTDVALRMLAVTEYPSFGWQITNDMEPATSLWESYDAPTMHQWVDESSRDHHYSASINTFLRKYLAGLDQPDGSQAWSVVRCRPEAAHWPRMLGTASATLKSGRGTVGCAWDAVATASPAPTPAKALPTVLCAMTPMFTGAVSGPSPMVLQCPAGQVIKEMTYAKWGRRTDFAAGGWYCYGPQPPPAGTCEISVAAKLGPQCLGKASCDLSASANVDVLGNPCEPPPPPISLKCPPGQHVDWVDADGDNGSCDCSSYCATNWGNQVKPQRPTWTGATSASNATKTNCICVQAGHWCTTGAGCNCKAEGTPYPQNFCLPGPPPPPALKSDPSLQLAVRVACTAGTGKHGPTDAANAGISPGPTSPPPGPPGPPAGATWASVNVTIPAGSAGEVHVPVLGRGVMGSVYESSILVWSNGKFEPPGTAKGVRPGAVDGRFVGFTTGPGQYRFTSAAPEPLAAPAPQTCRMSKDIGFPNETSGGAVPVANAEDCCKLCWLDPSCKAAAFDSTGGGICHLKTTLSNPNGEPVDGSMGCALVPDPAPSPSSKCEFLPNMQLYDPGSAHTSTPVAAATQEACCGICHADRNCYGAELYGTSCYVKTAKLPAVKQMPPPGVPLIACVKQ